MSAILRITRGSEHIDLISKMSGLHIVDWVPSIASYKSNSLMGNAVDSPLNDFSESRFARWDVINEDITVNAMGYSQDGLARIIMDLNDILNSAAEFWREEWSEDIVYLTVKGKDEESARHAVLYGGAASASPDIYNQPFLQRDGSSVSGEFGVSLVRGHWMSEAPGDTSCIKIIHFNAFSNYTAAMKALPIEKGTANSLSDRLAAMWPLNETSGVTANEEINGAAWDGTYVGSVVLDNVKFIDTQPAAKFDDATAYVDIGSSGLETLWNSNTASNGLRFRGSLVFWVKANSTIWGTVTEGTLFGISDAGILGTAQHLRVYKTNVAHTIAVSIFTGIDETTITANIQDHLGGLSEDSWVNFALVWNIPATNSETKPGGGDGEAHLYVQGILVSSAYGLNSYQDFEGTFEAYVASANINAAQLPPVIDSNMSHVMLFVNDLSPQEIAVVANPALFSRREDCDAQYVSNFFAEGRIDFVYRFDNSIATFTDLSAQVVPFDLLPTPLQVNDALYLGSDSHTFGGAVFNLIKGIGFTITWEYWNGVSWGGFTVSDPTNGLRRNGEVAVAWEFPNDWAQNNPGMGITAYWIRAKVATVPPSPWLDSPIQTEGVIYAVSSPYVDLQETDIGGDIPAIGRLTIDVKTASIGNNKVIVGKRSLSRGSNFSSYWNAGRLNLPFGITAFMSVGGAGSFAPSPQFAGGEGANWSPTIVSSGFESIIVWRVASAVSREYEGYYRAFVVIEYGGGTFADGDAALRLDYSAADVGATVTLPPRPIDFANNFIDLGFISFPRSSSVISVSLRGFALDVTGVWDITVVALLLVPVDEWALEVEASTANGISFGDTIIIDSTYDTNAHGRSSASIIERGNPLSGSPYASLLPHSTTGRLEFNHRRQERLWFFFIANGSDGGLGSQLYSVSVDGVKRYLGLRGAE